MPLVPITLPPGVYKNATPYSAKNRYADGNLIRWHNGSVRAVGGWAQARDNSLVDIPALVADPTIETIRDGLAWSDNSNKVQYIFGSNLGLYVVNDLGVILDVTPDGFVGGSNEPDLNTGYGKGLYGDSTFGTPRTPSGTASRSLFRWKFSTWGEDVIASYTDPELRGPIYSYSPGDPKAIQIPNAPDTVNGAEVADQRIIMTIGSTAEARRVEWSDRENREEWTPDRSNYAGGQTLAGSGALLSINKVLNQILILSDTDAHVARYIGAPYVFGFDRIGDDCGPLCAGAVQVTDRFAVWLGRRQFWIYDGTVRPMPCDVMDFLAEDIQSDMTSKISSGIIPQYNELWWLYQSKDSSTDVDSYVAFDYSEGHWSTGKINRSVLLSSHGLELPRMVDPTTGILYDHEKDGILVPEAWVETGPLEIGQGDKNMAVRYIFPDNQSKGTLEYTLLGRAMPTEPEYAYGPYSYNNPVSTRAMGREIRMRVTGLTLGWESGPANRFDVAPAGTGMR